MNSILESKITKLHKYNLANNPSNTLKYKDALFGLKNSPINYLKYLRDKIQMEWNKFRNSNQWYCDSDYIDSLNIIEYYIEELEDSKENEEKFLHILKTVTKLYY